MGAALRPILIDPPAEDAWVPTDDLVTSAQDEAVVF